MTAPLPPEVAARTAAALLAADPPEIARARAAIGRAHDDGRSGVSLDLPTADDLLGAVDYLCGQLAGTREALAIAEDRLDMLATEIESARSLCARSPLCVSSPPGGEG
jgi:hypothetical protein